MFNEQKKMYDARASRQTVVQRLIPQGLNSTVGSSSSPFSKVFGRSVNIGSAVLSEKNNALVYENVGQIPEFAIVSSGDGAMQKITNVAGTRGVWTAVQVIDNEENITKLKVGAMEGEELVNLYALDMNGFWSYVPILPIGESGTVGNADNPFNTGYFNELLLADYSIERRLNRLLFYFNDPEDVADAKKRFFELTTQNVTGNLRSILIDEDCGIAPATDGQCHIGSDVYKFDSSHVNTSYVHQTLMCGDIFNEEADIVVRGELVVEPKSNTNINSQISLFGPDRDHGWIMNSSKSTSNAPRMWFECRDNGGADTEILRLQSYAITAHKSILCDGDVRPLTTSVRNLGSATNRWATVYCDNVDTLSDRRIKENVRDVSDCHKYLKMMKSLKAQEYTIKSDGIKRKHLGFIAQDVKNALDSCEMDHCEHSLWSKQEKDDEENVLEDGLESLRYMEFIPLLLNYCQHLEKRIDALEGSGVGISDQGESSKKRKLE